MLSLRAMSAGRGLALGLGAVLLVAVGLPDARAAADRLNWRQGEGLVDAQIEGWPLVKLLEALSAKTRWQIYVEPETSHTVSAKFKELKTGEALRRLLGNLSYILIPAAGGPPKLLIFRTAMSAATELIVAPAEKAAGGATNAVPNELIVRLKPGAKETIEELAKRLGAKVVGRMDDLHAYRLSFADAEAAQAARAALAANPDVSAIEDNFEVARPDRPEVLSATSLPPFTLRPKANLDGSRVVVGLVDTPLQTQGTVLKDFLLEGIAVAGKANPPADQPTHGTTMAETILYTLARSPQSADGTPVRILPVDVYGDAPSTTTFDIARGIYLAINGGAGIINLSLGGESDSPLVRDVIKAGHDQGVIFLAAAGNEPVTLPTFPAADPGVLSVTALTRGGQVASYANRGDWVAMGAPGTSVIPYGDRTYLVVGTSAAAAYASGAAALLMATTHQTGADLEAQLRQLLALPPAKK